jgi:NAD(P)-dependent dehydrogenase (short-subunit alcohol dehydrogenase family)
VIKEKLAVITGCDSGIGLALTREFSKAGYVVAASYLETPPGADAIFTYHMDMTKPADVKGFITWLKDFCKEFDGIDFLVNNAGIALGGPVEDCDISLFREVFEVNFFSVVNITRQCIPLIQQKKGRIVNIGSMAGRIALPFLAPYAASKFALRGFTDSLRREVRPLGISTILVEPAAVATPIWEKALHRDDSFVSERYRNSIDLFKDTFIRGGTKGLNTTKAAEQIFRCITAKRPPLHFIVARNRFFTSLETLIPGVILDKITSRSFQMYYH